LTICARNLESKSVSYTYEAAMRGQGVYGPDTVKLSEEGAFELKSLHGSMGFRLCVNIFTQEP